VGTRSNDARRSWQTGTRLALVSNRSQIRHPEGKNKLATASLASTSQSRTPRRRSAGKPLDVFPGAAPAEIYSLFCGN
jgi:hypothetical protein